MNMHLKKILISNQPKPGVNTYCAAEVHSYYLSSRLIVELFLLLTNLT